jgi:hypothetical protein
MTLSSAELELVVFRSVRDVATYSALPAAFAKLVSFMDYELGYFDLETRVLEPLDNPFGPKLLPM